MDVKLTHGRDQISMIDESLMKMKTELDSVAKKVIGLTFKEVKLEIFVSKVLFDELKQFSKFENLEKDMILNDNDVRILCSYTNVHKDRLQLFGNIEVL